MSATITSDWRRRSRAALLLLASGLSAACRREPPAAEKTAPVAAAPAARLDDGRDRGHRRAESPARPAAGSRGHLARTGRARLGPARSSRRGRPDAELEAPDGAGLLRAAEERHADPLADRVDDDRDRRQPRTSTASSTSRRSIRPPGRSSRSPASRARCPRLERRVRLGDVRRRRGLVGDPPGGGGLRLLRLRSRVARSCSRACRAPASRFPSSLAPGVEQILARDGAVSSAELARFIDVPPRPRSRRPARRARPRQPARRAARASSARPACYQRIARDLYDKNLPDLMVGLLRGNRRDRARLRPLRASEDDLRLGRGLRAATAASSTSTTRWWTACWAVDAARRRGRRHADRQLGPWIQVGRGAALRALFAEPEHGGVLAPDRRGLRGLRRAGESRAPSEARLRAGPRADGRGADGISDRPPRDRDGPARGVSGPGGARAQGSVASVTVRRVAAEALSEKDASEYAKGLRALGYLSGGEPEKLTASGGDRPG